jgi:predicted oxidoreductase
MDAESNQELMENLAEFSKHIQGVGRMIGSTKITIGKLEVMKTCLEDGVKTLDIYLTMLKDDPTLL